MIETLGWLALTLFAPLVVAPLLYGIGSRVVIPFLCWYIRALGLDR
jgi:hypothetical protein